MGEECLCTLPDFVIVTVYPKQNFDIKLSKSVFKVVQSFLFLFSFGRLHVYVCDAGQQKCLWKWTTLLGFATQYPIGSSLLQKKVTYTVIPLYATFLLTPIFFTFCDKIPLIGIEFPY